MPGQDGGARGHPGSNHSHRGLPLGRQRAGLRRHGSRAAQHRPRDCRPRDRGASRRGWRRRSRRQGRPLDGDVRYRRRILGDHLARLRSSRHARGESGEGLGVAEARGGVAGRDVWRRGRERRSLRRHDRTRVGGARSLRRPGGGRGALRPFPSSRHLGHGHHHRRRPSQPAALRPARGRRTVARPGGGRRGDRAIARHELRRARRQRLHRPRTRRSGARRLRHPGGDPGAFPRRAAAHRRPGPARGDLEPHDARRRGRARTGARASAGDDRRLGPRGRPGAQDPGQDRPQALARLGPVARTPAQRPLCRPGAPRRLPLARGLQADRDRREVQAVQAGSAHRRSRRRARRLEPGRRGPGRRARGQRAG